MICAGGVVDHDTQREDPRFGDWDGAERLPQSSHPAGVGQLDVVPVEVGVAILVISGICKPVTIEIRIGVARVVGNRTFEDVSTVEGVERGRVGVIEHECCDRTQAGALLSVAHQHEIAATPSELGVKQFHS